MCAYKGDIGMKTIMLEALENLPGGIELGYEAIEGKIEIGINYADKERFGILDAHVNDLIKQFEDKGYNVTYDHINNRKFEEVLMHRRYAIMRKGEK